MSISTATRALVRARAGYRCEYCGLHEDYSPLAPLHIEHIVPKKHGGRDSDDNLALACTSCNLHKGPNLSGLDPRTSTLTALFHPRAQSWNEHFELDGIFIVGITNIGRTTVFVLDMNSDEQLALRSVILGEPE